MGPNPHKQRDLIQNLIITLLAVTAMLLFTQTQFFSLGSNVIGSYFHVLSGTNVSSSSADRQTAGLTAPVRVAVTGDYGRYANIQLTTTDEDFLPLGNLLREALGSSHTYESCGEAEFLQALQGTSVYYDFYFPLPLSFLEQLIGTSGSGSTLVRWMVIAIREENVLLYLWTNNSCLRCSTPLSPTAVEQTVEYYELGNAEFAFELAETDPNAAALFPCSLFLETEPELPVLNSQPLVYDTDFLLSTLNFNPNTQNRYSDAAGTEVIRESGRILRIHVDGTISYQSNGNEGDLSVKSVGEMPTIQEAVTGVSELLSTLLSPGTGNAVLYLQDIQQKGTSTTLVFGYHVNGIPVRSAQGHSAADVTLSGKRISALDLRLRQYTVAEETSLLLPLRQAVAIASKKQGTELTIGYADSGNNPISTEWMAN